MNTLAPLSTQRSLPLRSALVLSAATSEPPSGSVTAMLLTLRPAIRSGSRRPFCSSVPALIRCGTAISAWAEVLPQKPP